MLTSLHTAGWVRIVEATEDMAIATVTHACDGVLAGDYLETFAEPAPPPEAVPDGQPDYARPAKLVMADERRQSGYPGMLMLIDRGQDQDVRAGQRLTIFRQTIGGRGPVLNVGYATVLNVRPQTSLVRVDSRDAVFVGDLVALTLWRNLVSGDLVIGDSITTADATACQRSAAGFGFSRWLNLR